MRVITLFAALALTLLAFASPSRAQGIIPLKYKITSMSVIDLGTLGGATAESAALDINDGGDLVGMSQDAYGKPLGFIFMDGSMYNIHDSSIDFTAAAALSINNSRIVVGYYNAPGYSSSMDERPFYYYPGIWASSMYTDPFPSGSGWAGSANAINDYDRIAGSARNLDGVPPQLTQDICNQALAVKWFGAGWTPEYLFCIPDLDGSHDGNWAGQGLSPAVYDINNSNNMVGTDAGLTQYSMFFWNDVTQAPTAVPAPAGVPTTTGGKTRFGYARGLNDKNWVVGTYGFEASGSNVLPMRAFVWNGSSASSQDLGALPGGTDSSAFEINEQNMVVGSSQRIWTYNGTHYDRVMGYIWHSHFGMVQLPGLSGYFHPVSPFPWIPRGCNAYSINDRKSDGLVQVAGRCIANNGKYHAVRWDIMVGLAP